MRSLTTEPATGRFFKADPDDMSQGELSKRVHYLKTEKGGYEKMCEVAERIYEQGIKQGIEQGEITKAKEMALNMHNDGVNNEVIARYAEVSPDLVKEWIDMQ